MSAGCTSIGDSSTGFEHYITTHSEQSEVLNPSTIEALVYQVTGNCASSPAYLLPIGQTMNNVPAGFNTPQTRGTSTPTCVGAQSTRVVGTHEHRSSRLPNGKRLLRTPPMMHAGSPSNHADGSRTSTRSHGDCAAHPH